MCSMKAIGKPTRFYPKEHYYGGLENPSRSQESRAISVIKKSGHPRIIKELIDDFDESDASARHFRMETARRLEKLPSHGHNMTIHGEGKPYGEKQ